MLIGAILVICFSAGIALLAILSKSTGSARLTPQRFQELRAQLTNEDDIRFLLPANKILAIKLFREETGVSLFEAKEAIEAMIHELSVEKNETVVDQIVSKDDLNAEVIWNLKHKSKIVAIKVYRQRMQVGLKEAKQAVDMLAEENKSMPAGVGKVDPEKLQDLLLNKSKINAISYYRRSTGVGLKEAKEAVEWLEEDLLQHGRH